jgi:ribosome-associated heat shock protein Hsp15
MNAPGQPANEVRIDKWLWAVRLFKTRTLAATACRGGHVKIAGETVKPSRPVHPGEIFSVRTGEITRTVKVLVPIEKRVGAKLVAESMEDQTPASEFLKLIQKKEPMGVPLRKKGSGRPTKKERRQLDQLG